MSSLLIIFRRSFVYDGLFLSQCFQDSVFCLSTTWLWCVPAWFSFSSYYLVLSFLDVYIHVFHQTWEIFSHYSLDTLFLPYFSFWDSHNITVGPLDDVPQVSLGLFIFFSILSSFHFSYVFKFTDSFLCLLKSVLESL